MFSVILALYILLRTQEQFRLENDHNAFTTVQ